MFICVIAFGIFARITFPTMGEPTVVRWKYVTAEAAYEISPLIILLGSKTLAALMLDYFFLRVREKTIILYSCADDMENFIFSKQKYSLLLEQGKFWVIRMLMTIVHIIEPIWLDKRITDIDCQVAHKYHIKMLRFSHLVVDIKEITDEQALQVQLYNLLGLIEQQQEKIELCQFEIHEQQRKYAVQYQKYMDTDDEQKKDVHKSMMRHIGEEIDRLNKEKEEQEELLKVYQLQKEEVEQKYDKNSVDCRL